MRVLRTRRELQTLENPARGFVPTMGAFHEGHLALMRAAKDACGSVVVSLFVNPTQFAPGEDFARYPRNEARDIELAESAGVDILYAPSVDEMIADATTTIDVGPIASLWEGARRPGHFEGVATIVAKLFHQVQPAVAFFGLKDYQQCAVLRQMVRDLDFPVELRFLETVRERDGLAMSSRNRYLEPRLRALAPELFAQLQTASEAIGLCDRADASGIETILRRAREALGEGGFEVDYLALVDAETLQPYRAGGEARLIAAAKLGGTRLIDNVAVLWG